MNYLFRVARLIVIVIMLSALNGCAAFFAGGKVPKATLVENSAEDQTKPTLSYYYQNYSRISITGRPEFLEELNKSQYFKEITSGHSV
ncbi:MAG: hypothetical protein O6649_01405, partial [Gammaproteobacteria bacterium]|nr:hypothetical protein [Gammaproteobacteria bacterium]